MQARIGESKKNELVLHKDEIKMLLEEEIVSHYHLEKGGIEAGFKYDNDIKKATEIFRNTDNTRSCLTFQ